jgi:DNA replication and repair protein RecF
VYLRLLEIRNFRILESVRIAPSPHLNIFFGENAAGKTSLLEGIDFLSRGRSFKTRRFDEILREYAAELTVAGEIQTATEIIRLGIARSNSDVVVRLRGEEVAGSAGTAAALPVSVLCPGSEQLVAGTPSVRRAYLDWGLFHVEPSFHASWRRYQKALVQRNAALKHGSGAQAWDCVLVEEGSLLHAARDEYARRLFGELREEAMLLFGHGAIAIRYRAGWDTSLTFAEALKRALRTDIALGHTSVGPHRADLEILINARPAIQTASRGQLKLLTIALLAAQLKDLKRTGGDAVLLIDELAAELDGANRLRVLQTIRALGVQLFVSAVAPDSIAVSDWPTLKRFHVERGVVSELV